MLKSSIKKLIKKLFNQIGFEINYSFYLKELESQLIHLKSLVMKLNSNLKYPHIQFHDSNANIKMIEKNYRKLEIGPHSTGKIDEFWATMDMIRAPYVDIIWNIRNLPWPISDNVYELIYMSHSLEHVPWYETIDVLKEARRILSSGGKNEIWVPDLYKLISAYFDTALIEKDSWYKFNPEKDPIKWLNGRIFTYGPDENNWHHAAFDEFYLKRCMQSAGFINIQRLEKPRGFDHGWINLGLSGEKR